MGCDVVQVCARPARVFVDHAQVVASTSLQLRGQIQFAIAEVMSFLGCIQMWDRFAPTFLDFHVCICLRGRQCIDVCQQVVLHIVATHENKQCPGAARVWFRERFQHARRNVSQLHGGFQRVVIQCAFISGNCHVSFVLFRHCVGHVHMCSVAGRTYHDVFQHSVP